MKKEYITPAIQTIEIDSLCIGFGATSNADMYAKERSSQTEDIDENIDFADYSDESY